MKRRIISLYNQLLSTCSQLKRQHKYYTLSTTTTYDVYDSGVAQKNKATVFDYLRL